MINFTITINPTNYYSFIMFIVFTSPNKFTKTYTEAYQIAEEWYNNTGEIVAIEYSQHHNN